MKLIFGTILALLAYFVVPVPAGEVCSLRRCGSVTWYCSDSCCSSHCGCCVNFNFGSAYWYAWFLIVVFFFICLCACIGCGGYGYRRYYVVQRYQAPPATTVITAHSATTAGGYQPFTNEQYKPYQPQAVPPGYTADTAPPPYTKGY